MTVAVLVALLRTTSCTILAAVIAQFLLRSRLVVSPRTHQLVWCLVLLQGWAHFPIAIAARARQSSLPALIQGEMASVAIPLASKNSDSDTPDVAVSEVSTRDSLIDVVTCVVTVWLVGMAVVIARLAARYRTLVANLPLGRSPSNPTWQAEWKRAIDDLGVRAKAQFRVTDDVGPLCCFVPFFYLVVAPERLWCSLHPHQRKLILRHELAHLVRGDLWKSVVVRLLALPQWFNPFAWKAVHAFDQAAEWACDDVVVRCSDGSAVSQYPATLIEVAEAYYRPLGSTVGVRGGVLTDRIRRLVEREKIMEETKMTRWLIPAAFVLLFGAQSLRIVAAETDQRKDEKSVITTEQEAINPAIVNAREAALARTGLVPYRLAPPDILRIDAVHRSPYLISNSDVLQIVVSGLPSDETLTGPFPVDSHGLVHLGGSYDTVEVAGSVLEEAQNKIANHLKAREPNTQVSVSVKFLQASGILPISGQHLIGPDGFVNLGTYGQAYVAGMTVPESQAAIEEQLAKHMETPEVTVDVLAYNSKFYYVIVEGVAQGDHITRVPVTGNETVMDAIAQLDDVQQQQLSQKHVWISRPYQEDGVPDEILPVDFNTIARGGETKTNYPLLPGDRVFISYRRPNEARTIPAEDRWADVEQALMRGPGGTVIAKLPTLISPSPIQKDAKIRIRLKVLSDPNDNLAEYWGDMDGNSLLVDSDQLEASIRILTKNEIIKCQVAPIVMCPAGDQSSVDVDVDGFRIAVKPHVTTDEGVLLMAQIDNGPYSKTIGANAVLRNGETLLVRVRHQDDGTLATGVRGKRTSINSDAVYAAIAAEIQR